MTDRATRLTPARVEQLLVDTSPYLSCDDCFARIDEYVERTARSAGYRDALMETHLRGCGVCADEAASLAELLGRGRARGGASPDQDGQGSGS